MAKGIVVDLAGEQSTFSFSKVDREKLYGRKERVIVDENDQPCSWAWLTADGVALIPPGGTAYNYVNPNFENVERKQLKAVGPTGEFLTPVPSTLGVPQPLSEPVPPQRVLDFSILSVYELVPEALGETLRQALKDGKIYECPFNYREDYHGQTMLLLQNDQGIFALIGEPTGFDFICPEEVTTETAADEDTGDDLDFAMM